MTLNTDHLRALLEKATPGPWQAMNAYQWDSIIGDIDGPDDGEMHYESVTDITSHHDRSRANAALIAAAISALPALLAEVERLRKVEARWNWLADFPHLYIVNDLLKAEQYVTVERAVDALMDCEKYAALPTSGATEE